LFQISNFTADKWAEMGSRKSYSAFGSLKLMFTQHTKSSPPQVTEPEGVNKFVPELSGRPSLSFRRPGNLSMCMFN